MAENINNRNKLVSFSTIITAIQGDSIAMDAVISHYNNYIMKGVVRRYKDELGNISYFSDEDLGMEIKQRLMMKVLDFQVLSQNV